MLKRINTLWRSKKGRQWREYFTAYLMIAPAGILIFTFGIFPVLFAVYVSLHRWRIRMGKYVGLHNYVVAINSLAYLLFFTVAAGFLFFGWKALKGVFTKGKEAGDIPWLWAVPGVILGVAEVLWMRYAVVLLPFVLKIADKAVGHKRNAHMFRVWLWEALTEPPVIAALKIALAITIVGLAIWAVLVRRQPSPQHLSYILGWSAGTFLAVVGAITAIFTYHELRKAIQKAVQNGEPATMGVQVVLIAAGVILLFIAWKVWNSAVHSDSDKGFVFKGLAALFLIVGGWILIAELPPVIAAGDADMWRGLVVTVYYALGTIPFQLGIAIVLAYFLFQNIKGRELFRVLYFMPYITPTVASAAVFRLLFLNNPSGLVNRIFHLFGFPTLNWLWEPRGVFSMIASGFGISLPSWAGGPSLALVVIIIYSIWTYVGYDVVIYLAGLGNIPNEINEAAEIDGASGWQIFRYITLPLLSPITYFLSLIAVIGTFKAFNHIYVMRQPEALKTVNTFSVVIFDTFFTDTRYGYASALAFVLFAIILSLTYINNKVQGSRVFYQ